METRANYVLIGGFVVLFVLGLFGFAVWLAKVEFDKDFAYYDILFEGSVSGLSKASDVRFNGISVGSVIDLKIDQRDSGRVRVTIEVAAATPIRSDSVATLEPLGITGVSVVQIRGGRPDSPRLVATKGERLPVIASAASKFEELFRGAPELINRGIVLIDRASAILNDTNQKAIGDILGNLAQMSGRLSERLDAIDRVISAADSSAKDIAAAAAGVVKLSRDLGALVGEASSTLAVARGTLTGVDGLMERDLKSAIGDLRGAAQSVTAMSKSIDTLVSDNRDNVEVFTGEGLVEFARFVTEARLLISSISRITTHIEDDPARFLLGRGGGAEYAPEESPTRK